MATSFSVEFGGSQAEMHICFPYSMLEPIRDLLYSVDAERPPDLGPALDQAADAAAADRRGRARLHFGTARVSLRDIVDMRVGDVIPLAVQPLLQAEVDGVPVFECRQGTRNGRYALRVERFVTAEETDPPRSPGAQNG